MAVVWQGTETNYVLMHTTKNDYGIEDTASLSRLVTTVFMTFVLNFFHTRSRSQELGTQSPSDTCITRQFWQRKIQHRSENETERRKFQHNRILTDMLITGVVPLVASLR
jgi:hypothetical protein